MKDFWKALWEATKEPLRLVVLAAIPVALTWVSGADWKYAGVAILILRWIDSIMHEWGKEIENDTLTTGLTRF